MSLIYLWIVFIIKKMSPLQNPVSLAAGSVTASFLVAPVLVYLYNIRKVKE
jgi:hypothetical protein